jgi:two-component system sensor histidine kinase DegS
LRRLAGLKEMMDRAETLVTQVGVAMGFLVQNVRTLTLHLENAQQSRAMGIGIIKAQEEERRRVAREIHDGPAQLLANVVLRIDVCLRLFDSDVTRLRSELNQLKDLVRVSLQDVRKIIFDLRPMALDDLGLFPALRTYLKDFQAKTSIEAELVIFGQERRLDSVFEVAIFRLAQEALHNVNKHARAAKVWLKADLTRPDQLILQIRDDGVGFDPAQVKPSTDSGFGLTGMRERCDLLGGRMELESSPGNGTRLTFTFPLTSPTPSQA